jgi:uncharacterized membrane protein HdeD (DUF308 family)
MQLTRKQVTQQNWWLLALGGVVAIIFGLAIIAWPKLSLAIFVYLFGAAAVVYGIFTMCMAFSRSKSPGWWILPLGGFLSIVIGVLTFLFPHATGQFLTFLVAAWAILMGIVALVHAFSSAPSVTHRWLFVLAGLLSFLLGVFLFVRPTGILSVIWLIGAFSIVYGALLLISVMFPGKAAQASQSELDGTAH